MPKKSEEFDAMMDSLGQIAKLQFEYYNHVFKLSGDRKLAMQLTKQFVAAMMDSQRTGG